VAVYLNKIEKVLPKSLTVDLRHGSVTRILFSVYELACRRGERKC
jgi:hypothetical protein